MSLLFQRILIPACCLLQYISHAQSGQLVEPAVIALDPYLNVRDFTIASSGSEAYVSIQSPLSELSVIARLEKANGIWKEPVLLPFSGKYNDLEPFLSGDNLTLYFASNRPINDSISGVKDYDIWYVMRPEVDAPWGLPINMGAPVNTSYNEFYPAVANNGNLYYTSDHPNAVGKDDIFFSQWKDGQYTAPEPLNSAINTDGYEFNAYISRDDSFIIFSGYNRDDGQGSGDLYISFRDEENQWKKAINLGEKINSRYMDYCPFVDLASGTLYFTSRRSSFNEVYDFKTMEGVFQEISKHENGLSRIYKTSFTKEDWKYHE